MAERNKQGEFVWVTEDHCLNLQQITHIEFGQSGATVHWNASRDKSQLTGEESRQLELAIRNFRSLAGPIEPFDREIKR